MKALTVVLLPCAWFCCSIVMAWVSAGSVLERHERDLCFLRASCPKI